MAQWNGQFTGNTHATKVQDLEHALRHSVNNFRETNLTTENKNKAKTVYKLAEKLFNARLKFLKVKLYDAEPVTEENVRKQSVQIENLQRQIENINREGISGILIEFGAKDLII